MTLLPAYYSSRQHVLRRGFTSRQKAERLRGALQQLVGGVSSAVGGLAVCTRLQQGLYECGPAIASAVVQRAVALVVLYTFTIRAVSCF